MRQIIKGFTPQGGSHCITNSLKQVFDFYGFCGVTKDNLTASIKSVCDKMLNPPANLKGVNGIVKFSAEIKKWHKFDAEKLKRAGVTNYFQIEADGGTGGGIFRKMFGGFLLEAAYILQHVVLEDIGRDYIELSAKWDLIANKMWELHETGDSTLLGDMSNIALENCQIETKLITQLQELF